MSEARRWTLEGDGSGWWRIAQGNPSLSGERVEVVEVSVGSGSLPEGDESTVERDLISVSLTRGQWLVVAEAASSYDSRVPLNQGDGGECLRIIREAALRGDEQERR